VANRLDLRSATELFGGGFILDNFLICIRFVSLILRVNLSYYYFTHVRTVIIETHIKMKHLFLCSKLSKKLSNLFEIHFVSFRKIIFI